MSLIDIWVNNDFVVKVLLVLLAIVLVIVFEKIYQYYLSYRELKQLSKIDSLLEVGSLDNGFIKETLLEIEAFKTDSQSLYSSFIGVKLDLYEQQSMRYVGFIGVIAVIGPMLGLIGTFMGVSQVFEVVGDISLSDPSVIANGIKMVIVDTMSGLVVGVVAMVFYKTFEFLSAKNVSRFEEKVYKLIREK